MAALETVENGERITLAAAHLIGRSRACHLRLDEASVSGVHAEINWSENAGWQVKDRGSRNGTFLDGKRLEAGESQRLNPGCCLAFGKASVCYRLVEDSRPRLMATSESGTIRVADEHSLLSLPSADCCKVTVYRSEEGEWIVEAAAGVSSAQDQQWVVAGAEAWRLSLPLDPASTLEGTQPAEPGLSQLALCFFVSRDGEHLKLRVRGRDVELELPERTQQFLLLALAKARLRDSNGALPDSEHGWSYRDELSKSLGVTPERLNLWAYRCRREFVALGLRGAAAIIESRPLTRQVRIGLSQLHVSEA